MKRLLPLALCAIFALNAGARTLYVDAKRPNNKGNALSAKKAKKTIQAAINIAKKGDTILVYPGAYAPIKTNNKKITIKSVKGASKTTIVKQAGGNKVALASLGKTYSYLTTTSTSYDSETITVTSTPDTKGTSTTLAGFVLDGMLQSSSEIIGVSGGTVKSCIIQRVTGMAGDTKEGQVIYPRVCFASVARGANLIACTIRKNEFTDMAMVLDCTLNRCKLSGNRSIADDIYVTSGYSLVCNSTLLNCLISKNTTRSGYYGLVSQSTLVNCTAADNLVLGAKTSDGWWLGTQGPLISVSSKWYNCILRDNHGRVDIVSSEDENGCWIGWYCEEVGSPRLHNTDPGNVYKNTDKTNKNPKFANAAKGNYKLKKGSYCINKGKLTKAQKKLVGTKDLAGNKRIKGKAIDRGCYEY